MLLEVQLMAFELQYVSKELFDELGTLRGLLTLYTPGECPSLTIGRDSARRK